MVWIVPGSIRRQASHQREILVADDEMDRLMVPETVDIALTYAM